MDIIDLTCPLGLATPAYPGDPEVTVTRVRTHAADGFEVTRICVGSHSGTHLDAPRHFFPGAATLDEYPVGLLVGPGVIVDARLPRMRRGESESETAGNEPKLAPGRRAAHALAPRGSDLAGPGFVDPAFLGPRLLQARSTPGCFILLWTAGAYLSPEAAGLLLNFDPGLVGTDGWSLDPPVLSSLGCSTGAKGDLQEPETYPVYRLLLGNGVLIAEELCNLDRLGPGPVTCAFLPLAVLGTDGAPVRAIAWR